MTLMTLISDDDIKSCQESTSNVHSNDSMTMVELQGNFPIMMNERVLSVQFFFKSTKLVG